MNSTWAFSHQYFRTSVYKNFDEEGFEPSGGEGQKLALARALYKDAPIVLLDEPTAAMDPKAEYEIYQRFNEMVHTELFSMQSQFYC